MAGEKYTRIYKYSITQPHILLKILFVSDLGSNIGVFTLASLSMGNKVISVDPSPQNHAILFNSVGIIDR